MLSCRAARRQSPVWSRTPTRDISQREGTGAGVPDSTLYRTGTGPTQRRGLVCSVWTFPVRVSQRHRVSTVAHLMLAFDGMLTSTVSVASPPNTHTLQHQIIKLRLSSLYCAKQGCSDIGDRLGHCSYSDGSSRSCQLMLSIVSNGDPPTCCPCGEGSPPSSCGFARTCAT
jgi:hypothetical protein